MIPLFKAILNPSPIESTDTLVQTTDSNLSNLADNSKSDLLVSNSTGLVSIDAGSRNNVAELNHSTKDSDHHDVQPGTSSMTTTLSSDTTLKTHAQESLTTNSDNAKSPDQLKSSTSSSPPIACATNGHGSDPIINAGGKECFYCKSTETPMWRRDPSRNLICNACKLYLKTKNTYRTPELVERLNKIKFQNSLRKGKGKGPCVNCGTNESPYWRRDSEGRFNCNACGLYARYAKKARPDSLASSPTASSSSPSTSKGAAVTVGATCRKRRSSAPATKAKKRHVNDTSAKTDITDIASNATSSSVNGAFSPRMEQGHALSSSASVSSNSSPLSNMSASPLVNVNASHLRSKSSCLPNQLSERVPLPSLLYPSAPAITSKSCSSMASSRLVDSMPVNLHTARVESCSPSSSSIDFHPAHGRSFSYGFMSSSSYSRDDQRQVVMMDNKSLPSIHSFLESMRRNEI